MQNVNFAFPLDSKERAAVDILWKAFCAYLVQKGYMKDVEKHIHQKESVLAIEPPKPPTQMLKVEPPKPPTQMLKVEPPKPPTQIPSLPECCVKLHKIDVAKEKSRIERRKSLKDQPKSKPRELKLMQKEKFDFIVQKNSN